MRFGEGHGAGWSAGKEGRSLGYSKLTYEEYIENPEFYLARGILAPKWANELYGKGYKGVCAIDFYDDIFGGDLEEHRMPEDYLILLVFVDTILICSHNSTSLVLK